MAFTDPSLLHLSLGNRRFPAISHPGLYLPNELRTKSVHHLCAVRHPLTASATFPATAGSATTIIGAFYFLGGLCMVLAGLLEWVLGNTFPFVVFTTFGGEFWETATMS